MPEKKEGCVESSRGPLDPETDAAPGAAERTDGKEQRTMHARVGAMAPDFEAAALVDGTFKNIRLSEYRGHWVALCFYPGDFTFV
jgi:hypothetical protein